MHFPKNETRQINAFWDLLRIEKVVKKNKICGKRPNSS